MQKNVLEYLQASAARFPDKPAFTDEHEVITFAELERRGRSLGTYIAAHTQDVRENGFNLYPEQPPLCINRPVAVLVERSAATIAAFMGVLYSGNYYVPIESKMPAARIAEILRQLEPVALIYTQDAPSEELIGLFRCARNDDNTTPFPVLSAQEGFLFPPDNTLLEKRLQGILDIDPVYVKFTSGSTGTPKGIVISHSAVIDFTDWMGDTFPFSEADVMANQAPFYFDLSVKDVYTTLKFGATTHIIPKKLFMFPIKLLEFIRDKNTTALIWATAAFNLVANSGALAKIAPAGLNKIILGGEALFAKQLNIWRAALPNVAYVNLYGPTEVTVDCTYYKIDREYGDHEAIPIGYPCANKGVMLLDEDLQPVPQGQPGEICVRGVGLARGYYGDPAKTAAVFIQNPLNPWYPDVIYRTGDIGMLNDEGLYMYLCRRDGQIKRGGYRIELGEIETALSALPQMRELACFFDADKDKIVCAYDGDMDADAIITGLRDTIPKYMHPNVFRKMTNLPHNANGKIDRVKLKDDYFNGTD